MLIAVIFFALNHHLRPLSFRNVLHSFSDILFLIPTDLVVLGMITVLWEETWPLGGTYLFTFQTFTNCLVPSISLEACMAIVPLLGQHPNMYPIM